MSKNGNGKLQADRWDGIERVYTPEDVRRLRGTVEIEHTLARMGAERLWTLLGERDYLPTLGAVTGNQAVQMVKAGLEGIYVSGWQVAADANLAGATYPDQSLYPANSVPAHVRRLNNALLRADQIHAAEGDTSIHWMAPIVADAEAGFGGALNAFELMKAMIEAGAAGVHFEDQLASEKKCGHLGGKVLVPTNQFVRTLNAARLAADVCGVPTVLIARTDALSAKLVTSDADPADAEFLTGERTPEGFFRVRDGLDAAIARSLAYAPYADIVWFETSTPDLGEAREFAQADPREVPRQAPRVQLLARPSTGRRISTTGRSPRSRRSWARSATASSSSRWPASTRSTRPCSSSPASTRPREWPPTCACRSASSSSRKPGTRRYATSARSAPATSTWSPRRSARGRPPRLRSRDPRSRHNFGTDGRRARDEGRRDRAGPRGRDRLR